MYRDTATCQANYKRFIERTVASDEAWILSSASGAAVCSSNGSDDDEADDDHEDDEEETSVILFFSDAAYARRAQGQFPDHFPERLDLFDLLYRWLPGMSEDGVLAGPNWTGDLVGREVDPLALRLALEAALSPDQQASFLARYEEGTQ